MPLSCSVVGSQCVIVAQCATLGRPIIPTSGNPAGRGAGTPSVAFGVSEPG
jgi:hypothetical protein